jgi:hypothetical protein
MRSIWVLSAEIGGPLCSGVSVYREILHLGLVVNVRVSTKGHVPMGMP